ncbi:MAG TPA: hypothetical protein VMU60_01665 [Syntrophobacteria bacterium]|nr:hypothetical protein [Syntrophobacteria bacterium]
MGKLNFRSVGPGLTGAINLGFAGIGLKGRAGAIKTMRANPEETFVAERLTRVAITAIMAITTGRAARINPRSTLEEIRSKLVRGGILMTILIFTAGVANLAEAKSPPAKPAAKPPAQICEPKQGEVAVYGASGRCVVKKVGTYSTTSEIGLGDEPIYSIRVGGFTEATVCGITGFFDLRCQLLWGSGGTIKNFDSDVPWTFLQVARSRSDFECRPKDTEVTISGTFDEIGPCIRRGPGTYRTAEELGLVNVSFSETREKRLQKLRQEGKLLHTEGNLRVRTGHKVQATICERQGTCENARQGTEHWISRLGSMMVWNECTLRCDQVALFGEPDTFGPCSTREVGEYMREGGASRSIEVGALVEARTCSEENMKGECVDVKGRTHVNSTIGSLTVRSHPVVETTLTSDMAAPQRVNSTITFTAAATGGMGPYEYRFWLFDGSTWSVLSNWSRDNTYTWNPTSANPSYRLAVHARCIGCPWGGAPAGEAAVPYSITP